MNQAKTPKANRPTIRPHGALLILCALLLFIPNLHVIDLLPDAIACLVLLYIIAPYAVIDSHIAEAQRYLEHMLLIGAAQIVSVFFIYGFLSASPQEQPMAILLCCFVFAFFRIKTIFPLTRALGDGLMYLDTRNDGTMFCREYSRMLLFRTAKGKRRMRVYSYSVTDKMMNATRTFVVATSILNTVPELAALSYVPGDDTVFNLYDFIALLRGFFMLISLIFGILFLCRVVRFARDIGKDREYYLRLNDLYIRDEELHPERQTQKYLRRTFMLITLFSVFTMDFYMDRVNVLPDFIAALLLFAAFMLLRRYITHAMRYALVTAGYGVVSIVNFILTTAFYDRYRPESVERSERIRVAYIPVQILSVVEAIMLLIALGALLKALYEVIDHYTGYEIEGTANYSREQKLKEEHDALKRSLMPVAALGVATVLSGPLYTFLRPTVEFAWFFSVIFPAIFAVVLTNRLFHIRDSVDSRFMLM
ncbi:MAG: hypothetical protein IJW40_02505 [Clostridia bacterium]|nr:hypothetical protein [Clostridia bacterium]